MDKSTVDTGQSKLLLLNQRIRMTAVCTDSQVIISFVDIEQKNQIQIHKFFQGRHSLYAPSPKE